MAKYRPAALPLREGSAGFAGLACQLLPCGGPTLEDLIVSKRKDQPVTPVEPANSEGGVGGQPEPENAGSGVSGPALVELPEGAARRLTEELTEARDRHLRLAAEYDNFRKRTARERTETWSRAQAEVVSSLLDALDDLGRLTRVDPAQATVESLLPAVQMIERKVLKHLESAGLERVGNVGEAFNPGHHEAVGAEPASTPEQDHLVASVLQPGYRFGGALLRPARVRVYLWQDDGAGE